MNITQAILVATSDVENLIYSFKYAGLFAGSKIYIDITKGTSTDLGTLDPKNK